MSHFLPFWSIVKAGQPGKNDNGQWYLPNRAFLTFSLFRSRIMSFTSNLPYYLILACTTFTPLPAFTVDNTTHALTAEGMVVHLTSQDPWHICQMATTKASNDLRRQLKLHYNITPSPHTQFPITAIHYRSHTCVVVMTITIRTPESPPSDHPSIDPRSLTTVPHPDVPSRRGPTASTKLFT